MILFLRTRINKRLSTRFYKPRLRRIIYVVYVLNYSRLRCNLSIVYVDVFTRPREIMYVDKDRIMYYVKKNNWHIYIEKHGIYLVEERPIRLLHRSTRRPQQKHV